MPDSKPGAASTIPQASRSGHPPTAGRYWPEQSAWYAGPVAMPNGTVIALLLPENSDCGAHPYGLNVTGANDIHDGQANTWAMADAGSPAAQAVLDKNLDWYLPSRMEALQLFATLKEQIRGRPIWTSTQSSAYDAWYQSFDYGSQDIGYKGAELRAVAVRRLLLQSLDSSVDIPGKMPVENVSPTHADAQHGFDVNSHAANVAQQGGDK
jgi:hypothetical protein